MGLATFWKKMASLWRSYSKRFVFILTFCISILFLFSILLGPWSSRLIMSPREYMLMTHYLSSAIASYNTFGEEGTKKWLCTIFKNDGLKLLFVQQNGDTISCTKPDKLMLAIKDEVLNHKIKISVLKRKGFLIINNDSSNRNTNYWIISPTSKISWVNDYKHPITYRLIAGVILSTIVFFISVWLISIPILKLRRSFRKVSTGQFDERIKSNDKPFLRDFRDLNLDFNTMGESLEKFINLKDDVLEIISHELKSPLARQRAALNILKNQSTAKDLKYLDRILLENTAITDIIHDTLDYIKLHRDKEEFKKSSFDLVSLIKEITESVSFEFNETQFILETPRQYSVKADRCLLKIALENIIMNAQKHSPNESLIKISLTKMEQTLLLTIVDNGPGVMKENLTRIFEPYFSIATIESTTRSHGLGLAITKKIITLHHGTIKAKNCESGGLSIVISLPTA